MSHRTGKKFSAHHILRQKDPWEVARNAFDIALELALLGSVKEATNLFTLFETFSADCKSNWSPGLYFAWEATGLWPDSIPAQERTAEALKKLEVERILWKRGTNGTSEGLDQLIVVATGSGRTDAWGNPQLRHDDLIAALDLAIYMDKREKADSLIQIFADNFDLTWANLSKSRQAWQYLKHGALAKAIEVNEEKLTDFQNEVFDTFKERLEKGRRRVHKHLSMEALVNMCSENTLKNAVWEEMDVDPDNPPETILHKGATKEDIAELEKKLGHGLPEDYKEFLSLTNGMESIWNGFHGEPKLLGADEVYMADGTEQQRIMVGASVNIGFYMGMSVKVEWEPLTRVIQVNAGTEESKFVWFILPEDTRRYSSRLFAAIEQLDPDERAHVMKMMGYFYAGLDSPSQFGWAICVWSPQTLEWADYPSWHEYMEVLAGEAANEDILEERDEHGRLLHSQDIFAYSLR